ncbi:MAG: cation:proton antiporter [Cellulomonas sp.]|nr:cation:proton antiporter [Cellulomonas sp.]
MTFATLALVSVVALAGPALASRERWRVPVMVGELAAGLALGASGLAVLDAQDQTFRFLADIGFALLMFVAGTHVPVRDTQVRSALGVGALRAGLVGLVSVGLGVGVAAVFGGGHAPLYAVLLASSSAALVLPMVDSLRLGGPAVLAMTAQVAVADIACIVALPLTIVPERAGTAVLGLLLVGAGAGAVLLLLREAQRRGLRRRWERVSKRRGFALELRVNLLLLFALAALAGWAHISIMLAGFALGLVVAAVGEPRRLARQMFALADGFLTPLFYVWLGASLDLGALGRSPQYLLLALLLGVGAVLTHLVPRFVGQPLPLGALASAQLGVPVAAATLGTQTGALGPGEAAALLLAALVTIVASSLGGGAAARRGLVAPAAPDRAR